MRAHCQIDYRVTDTLVTEGFLEEFIETLAADYGYLSKETKVCGSAHRLNWEMDLYSEMDIYSIHEVSTILDDLGFPPVTISITFK